MGCVTSKAVQEQQTPILPELQIEERVPEQELRENPRDGPSQLCDSLSDELEQFMLCDPTLDVSARDTVFNAYSESVQAWEGQEVVLDTLSPYVPTTQPEEDNAATRRRKAVMMNVDLSNQYLGNEGAFLVQLLLRPKYRVQRLSLNGCGIGKSGGEFIANELQFNGVLRHLDLSNNPLGSAGVVMLVSHLPKAVRLRSLNLSNTNIDSVAAKSIAVALLSDLNMQELDLSNNQIESDGIDAVCLAAKACRRLSTCKVENNPGNHIAEGIATHQEMIDQMMESRSVASSIIQELISSSVQFALSPKHKRRSKTKTNMSNSSKKNTSNTKPSNTAGASWLQNAFVRIAGGSSVTTSSPLNETKGVSSPDFETGSIGSCFGHGDTRMSHEYEKKSSCESQSIETTPTNNERSTTNERRYNEQRNNGGTNTESSTDRENNEIVRSQHSRQVNAKLNNKKLKLRKLEPTVIFSTAESIGKRSSMLDYTVTIPDFLGQRGDHLFAIFDGHLGHHCARFSAASFPSLFELVLSRAIQGQDMSRKTNVCESRDSNEVTVPTHSNESKESNHKYHTSKSYIGDIDDIDLIESKGDSSIHSKDGTRNELTPRQVEECLRETFRKLNDYVNDIQIPHGSCALVCYLRDSVLYTASLGDSNAYLYHKVGASDVSESRLGHVKLSRTFRPNDPDETERIKNLNGFVAGDGRLFGLAVSRAIGDTQYQPYLSTEPHIVHQSVDTECCLVMASDGMWDSVTMKEVERAITCQVTNDVGKLPYESARRLTSQAIKNGSRDNVSVIIARIIPPANLTPVAAA